MWASTNAPDWLNSLSPRKRETFNGICRGLSRKEIAARLAVSPETVKQYTRCIFEQAGVHSTKELLAQLLGSRGPGWVAAWFETRAATPRECHQALLEQARQAVPGARVQLIAMSGVAPAARPALDRGQCWDGNPFYAPYWSPPKIVALAVQAEHPLAAPAAEQVHLLAIMAQARLAWLAAHPALERRADAPPAAGAWPARAGREQTRFAVAFGGASAGRNYDS